MAIDKKEKLSGKELQFVLKTLAVAKHDRTFSRNEKDTLYQKIASQYLNQIDPAIDLASLKFKSSIQRESENLEMLQFIIHVLAILTGYSEWEITKDTELDEIGLTQLKRETARLRINKYLKDNCGSSYITPSELADFTTVGDIYTLALTKCS